MKVYLRLAIIILSVALIMLTAHVYIEKIEYNNNKKLQYIINKLHSINEEAYFEGQRDYMNGDIRIEKTGNCYKWIKSPWNTNNATTPEKMSTFQPTCD